MLRQLVCFNGRSLQEIVDEVGKLVHLYIHFAQQCRRSLVCLSVKALCEQLCISFHVGHRRLEFMAHQSKKSVFLRIQLRTCGDVLNGEQNEMVTILLPYEPM